MALLEILRHNKGTTAGSARYTVSNKFVNAQKCPPVYRSSMKATKYNIKFKIFQDLYLFQFRLQILRSNEQREVTVSYQLTFHIPVACNA